MGAWQRGLAALAAVASVAFALPARALASHTQESIMQDDQHLIYSTPSVMRQTMRTIKSLGADRVKVDVVWWLVAPDSSSKRRPKFDASNPNDYTRLFPGAWTRYDQLVEYAAQLGLKVYFDFIGPAPQWAIPSNEPRNQGERLGLMPKTDEFRQFVEATGRRYSGSSASTAAADQASPAISTPSGLPHASNVRQVPPVTAAGVARSSGLPRVSYWGFWNEPNIASWLNPYYRPLPGGGQRLIEPELYRELLGAGWKGLQASGHTGSRDTFLIGELANNGVWNPTYFAENLYCTNVNQQPLQGSYAASYGCPASGSPSTFASQHPALFKMSGFSHHPYMYDTPPNKPFYISSWVTLQNLNNFEGVLNAIFGTYGQSRGGGVPIYLTEWGYYTNPPNPYVDTSLVQQSVWLNQGDYVTYNYPYVKALAQFQLNDGTPQCCNPPGSRAYWYSAFETGLRFDNGNPKPSFHTFRLPIWLPNPQHGSGVTVWGQVRPGRLFGSEHAEIDFLPQGGNKWRKLVSVTGDSKEGYFQTGVNIPSAGIVRLAWQNPKDHQWYFGRLAFVN